jgi:DNA-binding response OmpR family regulator
MGAARPKVVVLTSRDDAYSERRANELGIDAYLVKPYDPEELSATVTRLLGPSADRR